MSFPVSPNQKSVVGFAERPQPRKSIATVRKRAENLHHDRIAGHVSVSSTIR
jgi:hypothetical protein